VTPRTQSKSLEPDSRRSEKQVGKRRNWAPALIAAAALVAGLAVSWWGLPQRPVHPAILREPNANVLLITIDTLRADALGCYGNTRSQTPWIDRLAGAGIRFTHARAHNVVTLPSHANILSGRYPLTHGVRDNSGFRFPVGTPTVATILKAVGYRTAAFVSAFPVAARFGLNRGFDVYDDSFLDAVSGQPFLIQERAGTDTVARALRWIDVSTANSPWFVWVHVYEPHYPYAPPQPFGSRFGSDPYAGEVAAADAALAPLLDRMLSGKSSRRTLVILTGDHGESLGDHGEATHGIFGYEAALRVPLVIYDTRGGPAVVDTPVRHVDVLPTLVEALALPPPSEGFDGQSVLPLIEGNPTPSSATYFEALSATLNRGWAPLHGLVADRFKYIDLPVPELYDLTEDPREAHNLADAQPQRVAEMRSRLEALRGKDSAATRRSESAEVRARLESLGYVSGTTSTSRTFSAADDPKQLIALDGMLQLVVALYSARRIDEAVEQSRTLIAARPGMAISYLYLAQLERERGNLPAAVSALQHAASIAPTDATIGGLLASSLTEAGRPEEAVRVIERFNDADADDEQIVVPSAVTLARLHRFDEALGRLARAQQHDPGNARLLVESGTIHMMAGNESEARRAFERALEINAQSARAHSSLGAIAADAGRTEEAVAHWTKAVALDPRELTKVLALGIALDRGGRANVARQYFEFFAATAPRDRYSTELAQVRRWLEMHPKR
jgi:tetratricopeptide (TPR) repeat protein